MIVLRNKTYSPEEREYAIPSLKRRARWAIGKVRTKVAEKLVNAHLSQNDKYQAAKRAIKEISPIKNPKAENFLRKTAAERGILISNMIPVREMGVGGAYHISRPGIGDISSAELKGMTLSSRVGRRAVMNNELKKDYSKRLERLAKGLNGSGARSLVYVPKKGIHSGVDSMAHEVGHGSPTGWMKILSRDPDRQRQYLDKYEIIKHKLSTSGPGKGIHWSGKLGTNIKRTIIQNAEEHRATKEGLKLLKQSGAMSPEEMKQASKQLNLAYDTYKYGNMKDILGSLAEKVQIPSRRVAGGYYAMK
jgi:hypothetical protein